MDVILGRPRAEVTAQLDLARQDAAQPLKAGQHPDLTGAREAVVDALGWLAGDLLLSPFRQLPVTPTWRSAADEHLAALWSLDDEKDPRARVRANVIAAVLAWASQARDDPPMAWPKAS